MSLPSNLGQATAPNDWAQSFEEGMAQLEEQFSWATGAPLRGLNAYKTEGGWLLVVKTASVQRGALVSFYGGERLADCASQLIYDLYHNPGITWKVDKYAK